ncbi:MoaD/ThiS family protein [Lutispora sp.]|uniref:MoaD/ThiS family protein n=1 Tax=Lutispora sp. TaxID=2828727 RepID=UPI0035623C85
MALVRFLTPFNKITQVDSLQMDVQNIREMAEVLISTFGKEMDIVLNKEGNLSPGIVILVNRRNAHTLKGADTVLHDDSEVIILPYIYGG